MSSTSIAVEWKEEVQAFFERVMADLGHEGWTIRWCKSDAYCWRSKKVIDLWPDESEFECKQLLLHEIAHIDVVPEGGNQHTLELFAWQKKLSERYMGVSLSPGQVRFMAFYL